MYDILEMNDSHHIPQLTKRKTIVVGYPLHANISIFCNIVLVWHNLSHQKLIQQQTLLLPTSQEVRID